MIRMNTHKINLIQPHRKYSCWYLLKPDLLINRLLKCLTDDIILLLFFINYNIQTIQYNIIELELNI